VEILRILMNENTSNDIDHVVLKSSLSTVNQYGYITCCVGCVAAHSVCTLGVMVSNVSNTGQFRTFFSVMQLPCCYFT
jgi:hypothetical protein